MQKGAKNKWTVCNLRELLNDYISAREKCEQSSAGIAENRNIQSKPVRTSTEALMVGPKTQFRRNSNRLFGSCRYCNESHWNDECSRYPTVEARKRRIKGSCFICLKQGHKSDECTLKKSCYYCGQMNNHHRSLCPEKFGSLQHENVHLVEETPLQNDLNRTENVLLSSSEMVLMQTSKASIKNAISGVQGNVRILFDTGSQRTFITESLARRLGLKRGNMDEIMLVTFGSDRPQRVRTPSTTLDIELNDGSSIRVSANIVPNITGTIHRGPLQIKDLENWDFMWSKYSLADTLPFERESSSIELLIGSDFYLDLILPQRVEIKPGLYMLATKLGWMLSGRVSGGANNDQSEKTLEPNMLVITYGSEIERETSLFTNVDKSVPTKHNIEDFWKLETIGIYDSPVDAQDNRILRSFLETLKYEGERYYVNWPWKDESPDLPENRELAFGRFKSLMHRMKHNSELIKQYDNIIQDQHKLGIIERIRSEPNDVIKHYIPHHAVINPLKTTTKVRVVYDASAKAKKSHRSLNECLYRGPVMLQDLIGILLRFRLNNIAIVADIEKAFLQIGLNENAKDVTRFFWIRDINCPNIENNIQVYRFCRVPFGIISSPFLLSATLNHHLDSFKSCIAENIRNNIYVDNVITGTDTVSAAVKFYKEAKQIFTKASMNLRDWTSNSPQVLAEIPVTDKAQGETMKVLGLTWSIRDDTLSLKLSNLDSVSLLSKRMILKQIASVYDPLGLFNPVTLRGKLFLQNLWNKKYSWDDKLPKEEREQWNVIKGELKVLTTCKFPRHVGLNQTDDITYRLLGFCDASKQAYAAVIYLHQSTKDFCKTDIVFSKLRLAPNKEITIPRLELLAALIGTRCIQFVAAQLQLPIVQKHLWIDSQCVLSWICNNKLLTQFVENRVAEIKKHNDITFHYIPSKENPADIASRGVDIDSLLNSNLWWTGPEWLTQSSNTWPVWNDISTKDTVRQVQSEYKKLSPQINTELVAGEGALKASKGNTAEGSSPFGIDIKRFSSVTRLLRVTALVSRFINKLKKKNDHYKGQINPSELERAERQWIAYTQKSHYTTLLKAVIENKPNNLKSQLGVYVDEKGLLRCRGRLERSDINEGSKLPLLLPKDEYFTQLIIEYIHKGCQHAGIALTLAQVRQNYWVPQGRSAVKRILKNCTVCRRWEGGPYQMPPMPPLPRERVTESVPFSHTGIDYFGPLFTKTKTEPQKMWVCLFTCLVTRAVHLELLSPVYCS
ncbi:MAG: aspartyl protease family protein [Candidatus Thiodiazotropha sp. (ex Ctena orbiculata)]|nr:aspartyl protease family protein [Candidatus Thiodiazotropha taylori]